MSIQSEINRLSGNVGDTLSALRNTGTSVPSGANSDSMAGLVSQYAGEVTAGKALVAAAVTEKGVETPADATFQQIAENVAAIESGGASIEWQQVDVLAEQSGKMTEFNHTFVDVGEKNILVYSDDPYYCVLGLIVSGATDGLTFTNNADFQLYPFKRNGDSVDFFASGMLLPMSQLTLKYVVF